MQPHAFQKRILNWYQRHGRHDLPWQKNPTAYRVWVSEIMLQQTQVTTVLPFYKAFMKRFPSLKALASAPLDDVLAHWSGLGYYARARNLHKAASQIYTQNKGRFPTRLDSVMALPGIGRSTAGAILAFSMHQPTPILDGNVKRVLTRFFGITQWPGKKTVHDKLWDIAEQYTPQTKTGDYNQAMMDLGATICKRTQPVCTKCPIQSNCRAWHLDKVDLIPAKKPKTKARPQKAAFMLMIQDRQSKSIFLQKRPASGIWGGLWSFPECAIDVDVVQWCKDTFALNVTLSAQWPPYPHQFSHYEFIIHPVVLALSGRQCVLPECVDQIWQSPTDSLPGGMPAPVSKLLSRVFHPQEELI